MRLFAAVVPPAAVIEDLVAAVDPVRATHPGLQWVPSARWHLTLAFYGEVPESTLPRVRRRLDRATRDAPSLSLSLRGAGRFRRQVVWIGVTGDVEPLVALAARLAADSRPYRPHLTVARVRSPAVDPRGVVQMLETYDGRRFRVAEIVLFRSHLGPKPWHEPLDRRPLSG